jgi:hypothetical protein
MRGVVRRPLAGLAGTRDGEKVRRAHPANVDRVVELAVEEVRFTFR